MKRFNVLQGWDQWNELLASARRGATKWWRRRRRDEIREDACIPSRLLVSSDCFASIRSMSIQIPRTIDTFSNTRRNTKQMKRRARRHRLFILSQSVFHTDILQFIYSSNCKRLQNLISFLLNNWRNIFQEKKGKSGIFVRVLWTSSLSIEGSINFLTLNQEKRSRWSLNIVVAIVYTVYTVGYLKKEGKMGKGMDKEGGLDIANGHC